LTARFRWERLCARTFRATTHLTRRLAFAENITESRARVDVVGGGTANSYYHGCCELSYVARGGYAIQIPEPATPALVLSGLFGIAAASRRRR
jgi:hypothetical protein